MIRNGATSAGRFPVPLRSLALRPVALWTVPSQAAVIATCLVALILSSPGCDASRSREHSEPRGGSADQTQTPENSTTPEPTIEAAARAFKEGDFVRAEAVARQLLISNPANLDAGLVLVNLSLRRSDPIAAAEILIQISNADQENRHLLRAQAAEYFEQGGNAQQGIELLGSIVRDQPTLDDIRRRLAAMLNAQGFRFDANEHLRYLAGRITLTPQELIALVNPLLTWATFPSKPDINDDDLVKRSGMLNVVAALRANGDVRDALTLLESSELLQQMHPAAVAMHGWLLSLNQDFPALKDWAAKANDESQRYPAYWLGMGNLMLNRGQGSAVECFCEALKREPGAMEALSGLGQALAAQKRPELESVVRQRQQAINESQALAYKLGSANGVDPSLAVEIGRVLNSVGRPIESLAWQEAIYGRIDPAAAQLIVLRQHKARVLQQFPDGRDPSAIVCGINATPFGSVKTQLAMLRSNPTETPIGTPILDRQGDGNPSRSPPIRPVFTDIAKSAGITMRHLNADPPVEKEFRLFEALGSGVACLDCDNDGKVDLYLGQAGGQPPKGPSRESNRLIRNLGDRFDDVTRASDSEDFGYTHGVTAGDWNQDGFTDLVIGNVGVNRMLINRGDGTFVDAALMGELLPRDWNQPQVTTSIALADVTGDGLPDIFETNYVDDERVYEPIRYGGDGKPIVLPGPKHFNAAAARLFVTSPNGQMHSASLGPTDQIASTGLGVLITDIDDDRQNEIFVANDQNPNHLWKRVATETSETWVDLAITRGCAFGTGGKPFACMGIAAADFDRNGTLDLHLTNFNGECSNLYMQDRSGAFVDRAIAYRLDEPTVPMVGFGTQAFDYDNNSSMDLVIANGHIEDLRSTGKPFRMPTQILSRSGNQFQLMDVGGDSGYWSTLHLGRAVAILDWNRDGRVDLAVTDLKDDFALLENRTDSVGHFLQLRLIGTQSERDAIGAKVTVESGGQSTVAVVQAGDGYLCRNEAVLSFGLGDKAVIDQVTVHWPSDRMETFDDIEIDSRTLLVEGQSAAWRSDVSPHATDAGSNSNAVRNAPFAKPKP